jgi:DNA-binding PadR family transcriptional regulator
LRLYNAEIDKAVIDELYQNEKLGYLELKRRIEARLGYPLFKKKLKRLSLHTYSSHLNKLLANNYIKKSGEGARGRNKTVDYSLTEKGEQDYRLKILQHKSNNTKVTAQRKESREDKYRRSYRLLFLVDQVATGGELYTEEDLERFLTGIGKSRSDLMVDTVKTIQRQYQSHHYRI